jgi:hypothetical protein
MVAWATAMLLVLAAPEPVFADTSCTNVEIRAGSGLSNEWQERVRELEDELRRAAGPECEGVSLSIQPDQGRVRIVATAADGRRAERMVTQPSALAPTVLGLVMSIPRETPNDQPTSPPQAGAAATRSAPRPESRTPTPSPQRSIDAWLGFAFGARAGEPASLVIVDVEGRADLLLRPWLLFASFRYTPVAVTSSLVLDLDEYNEIALALGAGRRIEIGPAALDLGLAPELVGVTMEGDFGGLDSGGGIDVRESAVQLRVDLSARWMLPLLASWRLSVTADGDFAPSELASPLRLDSRLPPLPSWTVGLRLGASGAL